MHSYVATEPNVGAAIVEYENALAGKPTPLRHVYQHLLGQTALPEGHIDRRVLLALKRTTAKPQPELDTPMKEIVEILSILNDLFENGVVLDQARSSYVSVFLKHWDSLTI